MATHSSTLAWKIPWMEEPGRLQSMGSLRVWHNGATSLSLFTFLHWRRKWQPTPVLLPGESQGWGSLVGCHLWGCRVKHNWSALTAAAAPPPFLSFLWVLPLVHGKKAFFAQLPLRVNYISDSPLFSSFALLPPVDSNSTSPGSADLTFSELSYWGRTTLTSFSWRSGNPGKSSQITSFVFPESFYAIDLGHGTWEVQES